MHSPSPPPLPAYSIGTSSSMEKEFYINGKSIEQGGQGHYHLKERQHEKNPCNQCFKFIRSNFFR